MPACSPTLAAADAAPTAQPPEPTSPAGQQVCGLKQALQPSDQVRWVPATHELDFPPVPFPPRQVLHSAGEATLRALVLRQHQRLLDSPLAPLFPSDPSLFAAVVQRSADFVVEACGGGEVYSARRGHSCMRTRHLPFTIDEAGREQWLRALWLAFDDVACPDAAREPLWTWLEAMSIRMVNRRTTREQPVRLPYAALQDRGPDWPCQC